MTTKHPKRVPNRVVLRNSNRADAKKPYVVEVWQGVWDMGDRVSFYFHTVGRYSWKHQAIAAAERACRKHKAVCLDSAV